jgi:subtilisin family serine protease
MRKQIRLLLRLGVILAILVSSIGSAQAAAAAEDTVATPLVDLIEKARAEGPLPVIVELTSVAAQDAVIAEIDGLDADVNVEYDFFPLLALSAGPEALSALGASERVVRVTEDIPQPPALAGAMGTINGDDVQTLGWTGDGQTVAILDTGIDADHPFFAGRIVSQACYSNSAGATGDSSLCSNGMTTDTGANAADAETANCLNGATNLCDHGSHVAGIAAGATTTVAGDPGNGVAPDADIIAIQVFTRVTDSVACDGAPPCVLTYAADQILGLQRVLALDPTLTISSANMSLGGGSNSTNCDAAETGRKMAVDALAAAGIATVISAGNDAILNGVGAPGCISTAVTVGSTNADDDSVSSFSNRGGLLDIFAPGCRIGSMGEFGMTSAVPDDTFGFKCGTSMAAPMVTGAFAVLREAYPTATVATLLGYMQSTGVAISYDTNGDGTNDQTTPRLNLLAALQAGNSSPNLTVANPTVTVDEGQTATNTGTFADPEGDPVTLSASVGTVTGSGGNWSWSFGATDGPTQSQTVTITGADNKGETGTASFGLVVENVDPVVTLSAAVTTLNQGQTFTGSGSFTDPGADTWTVDVDYGDGSTDSFPPNPDKTFGLSHPYFQSGNFTVEGCVTDDDSGKGCDTIDVTVKPYAIFASRSDCGSQSDKALSINGTTSTFYGDVTTNSGLQVGGSRHTVNDVATFRCTTAVGGSGHKFGSGPTQIADVRPSPTALTASAFTCDVTVSGKLDLSKIGVWWVGGTPQSKQLAPMTLCATEITLSGSSISGQVTLVADKISVNGSRNNLTAHEHDVVAFATGAGTDALRISDVSGSRINGSLMALSGQANLVGSGGQIYGSVFGRTVSITGSNWMIDAR